MMECRCPPGGHVQVETGIHQDGGFMSSGYHAISLPIWYFFISQKTLLNVKSYSIHNLSHVLWLFAKFRVE